MIKKVNFPEPKIIAVNNIELEVFEAGEENRERPIVLCHGWPEHAYSWRSQIPALVAAGYHVIVPNQRGFGNSSCPSDTLAYDIDNLTKDLLGILDHYGYEKSIFMGHDWGSAVVWAMGLLHPERVVAQINLALPYQERGELPWVQMMEKFFGDEYYFVHFNKRPGVADKILNENVEQFFTNLFRKNAPSPSLDTNMMIDLATSNKAQGEAILSAEELNIFISAFEKTGFTPSINWYRNLDRNWHILGKVDSIIKHPVLMIYGQKDLIPKFERISQYVPNISETTIESGHWIQQECPDKTNKVILEWLEMNSR
ncbi:putative lysophospholipase [Bacteriovorax sp. BSW11_IV]|uniref:alpha/beta fold hydrolase n=1 Tax=Bacteriovorax sp. BSW11_IV TaxID=1353529 RepID=UPI00038A0CC9|nr:alpha/beta hydrolase [Bacteriovorax sp. BSW11_IV]EQC44475.1 putative lysophospholipase [Bacteriovorax sp. BSW11_IV]